LVILLLPYAFDDHAGMPTLVKWVWNIKNRIPGPQKQSIHTKKCDLWRKMVIFGRFSHVNCIWRPRRDAYFGQMGPKPKKSDSWPSKTVYKWEKRDFWRKKPIFNDSYFVIFCYIKFFEWKSPKTIFTNSEIFSPPHVIYQNVP